MTGASAMRAFAPTGKRASGDALTLQGDLYRANIGQLGARDQRHRAPRARPAISKCTRAGGNVLGRWRRQLGVRLRPAAARLLRPHAPRRSELSRRSRHLDVDLQHRFLLAARHEIVWGLNYRYTDNSNRGKGIFAVVPAALARPAVQRLRPGPVRALGRAAADARHEARAQRLQRFRGAAERATRVGRRSRPERVGRGVARRARADATRARRR